MLLECKFEPREMLSAPYYIVDYNLMDTRKFTHDGNFILKQFETILFLLDMIQDIYKLHWNIIHKSTAVT